jgi:hypothetical protein
MLLKSLAAGAAVICLASGGAMAQTPASSATFSLKPNPGVAGCFEKVPGVAPVATVFVANAGPRDKLTLTVTGLKPKLKFDMFTVQRSNLLASGEVDLTFKNFGMAWYQSDLNADATGKATTSIATILINQIFGFDPDVTLAPTNTFHVGFWFNSPADAAGCGFTGSTPFNGEHVAGPVAMISVPNAKTGLGPLCLSPNTATKPATCNP